METLLKEKLADLSQYLIGILKEERAPEISKWEQGLMDIQKELHEIDIRLHMEFNIDYSNKFLNDAEDKIREMILDIKKAMDAENN